MPLEQFLKLNKLYFFDLKKIKKDIESFCFSKILKDYGSLSGY
jgi:hypothetical protein